MGTRWGHRALGARWWAAALVVPAALAGLVVAVDGDDLEADIRDRVRSALAAEGVDAAGIEVDGRDVTVSGLPAGSDTGAVRHAVGSVQGVRQVAAVGAMLRRCAASLTIRGNVALRAVTPPAEEIDREGGA